MKFLIFSTTKDTASTLPPAIARQLLEATLDYVNQLKKEVKKEGEIFEIYELAGTDRTMIICEYDSAEELTRVLCAVPFAGYESVEIYPLSDFNEYMKDSIESLKKAEQLFPSQ